MLQTVIAATCRALLCKCKMGITGKFYGIPDKWNTRVCFCMAGTGFFFPAERGAIWLE